MLAAIVLSGWIDGYYAWNGNHPDPKIDWFEGVGTSARRTDRLALNDVALEIRRDPKPFGFHFIAGGGDSFDVVHLAERRRRVAWLRCLYQASATYARGKLLLETGIYPSHIGYEGLFTKDQWNYTRNWLGEFSPYYQSGVRAAYSFTDRWSGQLHVLNGWQNVSNRRGPLALGVQGAYSAPKFSAAVNTYDGKDHRNFLDLVATYKLTPKLSLGLSADAGRQSPANWSGASGYARYALSERYAVAGRVERYRDPDGFMSGTPQTLSEETLTLEVRADRRVIVKFEARADRSTAPVFSNHNNQRIALCGISLLLP